MSKRASPRMAKPTNGNPARRRRNNAAPGFSGVQAPAPPTPSHEELAARAYGLFLARGCQPGDEWRDWFQAEAELRREMEQRESPSPE